MFKRLNPSDYPLLLPYFKKQTHRLCYYSLSSCIAWKHRISNPVWFDDVILMSTMHTAQMNIKSPDNSVRHLPLAQLEGRTAGGGVAQLLRNSCASV